MSPASPASTGTKPFLFERSFDDPSKVYLPGEKFGPKVKVDLPKPKTKSGEQASDGEKAAPEEPPPPPPKTFTEAELEAAREEGYVEGHTSALEEAETAREHYVADALNIVSQSLDGLEEQQTETNKEIGQAALRLVYAVIEKVVPTHAQAHAVDSVEALVRDVLPLVYDEPTLVVRTHNMIAEDVQARMEDVVGRSNFTGSVTVMPDYELQPGDCRVDWKGGGADRDEGRLWSDIRAVIKDNIGPVDVDALDAAADADTSAAQDAESAGTELPAGDQATEALELQEDGNLESEDTTQSEEVRDDTTGHEQIDDERASGLESAEEALEHKPEKSEEKNQEPGQPASGESVINQDDDEPLES